MKIGILGFGIVGEVTSKVFGTKHEIFPYDLYREKYNSLENLKKLARESEVVFVCVPTPMKPSGEMDYSILYDSLNSLKKIIEEIGRNPQELIVTIRSTTVSGTTDKLAKEFPFKIAFNPEFLTERTALEDMKNTNRIILGVEDELSKQKLIELYKVLFPNAKYIIVNRKTAEMIKYAANVTLASQVAIANEIYQICKTLNIDYNIVKDTIILDPLIGKNNNVPGPDGDFGFGGKCLPKDLNALIYLAREHGYRPHFLEGIWSLNERVRKNKNWLEIPGATSKNQNFKNQ
ncbi:MAG: nucleotide sugar dehydrogenase [Nanoarchaeota archaeon]|nr:nucleotide sugar dehydrogenase [Nanoarchaeota archaeon]